MPRDHSPPRVAYFTAGTVGAGHVVRGEALGRGLARASIDATLRVFAPPGPFRVGPPERRVNVAVKGDSDLDDPARAAQSALGRALRQWDPDLLIVDMFWAPIRHVLPTLRCPAWLLVRACPPVWMQGRGATRFDPGAWERIVEIEPLGLPHITHRLDPIVIANPDECQPPAALRARLGVPADHTLTVVSHAGKPGELSVFDPYRTPSEPGPHTTVSLDLHGGGWFPAAHWLQGADRIVCAAGYNSFWEAQWLGWDARTHFVALERSIDRQQLRLDVSRGRRPEHNGADTLARWVAARLDSPR